MIDEFVIYQPTPRDMHYDRPYLWAALEYIWSQKLKEFNGMRMTGPLYMKAIGFGYIDDMTLREVHVHERSREWTLATWRISGMAAHP